MNFLGFLLIAGACVYIVCNVVSIVKTLKSRKTSASDQNKHDEEEVDQRNSKK